MQVRDVNTAVCVCTVCVRTVRAFYTRTGYNDNATHTHFGVKKKVVRTGYELVTTFSLLWSVPTIGAADECCAGIVPSGTRRSSLYLRVQTESPTAIGTNDAIVHKTRFWKTTTRTPLDFCANCTERLNLSKMYAHNIFSPLWASFLCGHTTLLAFCCRHITSSRHSQLTDVRRVYFSV